MSTKTSAVKPCTTDPNWNKDSPSECLIWQYYYVNSQPYKNHKTLNECNSSCLLLVPNVLNKITDWCCSTHNVIGHLATIYKTWLTLQDIVTDPPSPPQNSSTALGVQHHLHLHSFTLPVHLSQFPGLRQLAVCLNRKPKVSSQTYPYRICDGNITSGCGFLQVLQLSPDSINALMLRAHSLIQYWHNITLATDSIIK